MKKQRVGRPRLKPEDKVKSVSFSVRLPVGVKADLEVAAKNAGRKLNAEIFNRLIASLEKDTLGEVKKAFGGERTFYFMMMLAEAVESIEVSLQTGPPAKRKKGKWLDDPFIYSKVCEGLEELLAHLHPEGEAVPPEDILAPTEHIGIGNVLGVLDGIRYASDERISDKVDENGVKTIFSEQSKRNVFIKQALGKSVVSRIGKAKR
jgi:hypothetical protein